MLSNTRDETDMSFKTGGPYRIISYLPSILSMSALRNWISDRTAVARKDSINSNKVEEKQARNKQADELQKNRKRREGNM